MRGLCSIFKAHLCMYRRTVFLAEYYMDMLNILYDVTDHII